MIQFMVVVPDTLMLVLLHVCMYHIAGNFCEYKFREKLDLASMINFYDSKFRGS